MRFLMKTLQTVRGAYIGKYSIITNTITAGSLGFLGDAVAQKSERKFSTEREWDKKRTANMALVCTVAGPVMHIWYKFLDGKFPGRSPGIVATKVMIDLLSGPIWYGWFIGGLSTLRGNTLPQTVQEFKDKLPIIIAIDLTLWPIFQGMNFALFPPHYRILVLKCNELVFDVIFSHIANHEYTFSSLITKISKMFQRKSAD
ncbi:mpv17-like protein 2 [Styela clava]